MAEDLYRVFWLPDARSTLKELAQRAKEVGLLASLKQVLAELNGRLEREPLEVGELYRGKAIEEHVAAHKLIGINFAIDKERKVVAVRRCWATPNAGF